MNVYSTENMRFVDGETILLQKPAALKRLLFREVAGGLILTSVGQYQWQAQEPSSSMHYILGSMHDVYEVVLKKSVVRLDRMAFRLSNKVDAEQLYKEAHAFLRQRIVAGENLLFAERAYIKGLFRKCHGWVILTDEKFRWRLDTHGGVETGWQSVDDVRTGWGRKVIVTVGSTTYRLRFRSEFDAIGCSNQISGRIR